MENINAFSKTRVSLENAVNTLPKDQNGCAVLRLISADFKNLIKCWEIILKNGLIIDPLVKSTHGSTDSLIYIWNLFEGFYKKDLYIIYLNEVNIDPKNKLRFYITFHIIEHKSKELLQKAHSNPIINHYEEKSILNSIPLYNQVLSDAEAIDKLKFVVESVSYNDYLKWIEGIHPSKINQIAGNTKNVTNWNLAKFEGPPMSADFDKIEVFKSFIKENQHYSKIDINTPSKPPLIINSNPDIPEAIALSAFSKKNVEKKISYTPVNNKGSNPTSQKEFGKVPVNFVSTDRNSDHDKSINSRPSNDFYFAGGQNKQENIQLNKKDIIPVLKKTSKTIKSKPSYNLLINQYNNFEMDYRYSTKPTNLMPSLVEQGNQCYCCHSNIERKFFGLLSNTELCQYTGKWCCNACIHQTKMRIPWRILESWDFNYYKVCKSAYQEINRLYDIPNIVIDYNDKLVLANSKLHEFLIVRRQIHLLYDNICNHYIVLDVIKEVNLLLQKNLFSLRQLIEIWNGTLQNSLKENYATLLEHIRKCETCQNKMRKCEICGNNRKIYVFDIINTSVCEKCHKIYHASCFKMKGCVNCALNN